MRTRILCLIWIFLEQMSFAQNKSHIAFINATAHIGNGEVIENALFVINAGKIESLNDIRGIKLNPLAFDTVIDLGNAHIYPALINCNSVLGLHDAEAVRAGQDFAEVGQLNPHIRALIAYNTDNVIVPTVKSNGVLYSQVTPRGGLICGSSSVMALEGWNWEDAVLKADDGIHLNFPRHVEALQGENDEQYKKKLNVYKEQCEQLDLFFREARAYFIQNGSSEINLRFEAMRKVFSGKARLYVHADKARDILKSIAFIQKYNIPLAVLVGAKDAAKVLEEIKASQIPVMLNRVNDLPDRPDEDVDQVYRLPALLQNAGILFCLQMEGDMEAAQSRNLPFNAGSAVGYGLGKEQALAAVSLNAARIMGIEKLAGSLEEGKLASFVLCQGDILDIRGNRIIGAYLAGKQVNLNNRQTELYRIYMNKYNLR
ncbi:MAG TPA: amidohydrolase family protein [Bacteroidia bacterium]|nr:amidohydrolase family protein [Bacteroidia bacterium]